MAEAHLNDGMRNPEGGIVTESDSQNTELTASQEEALLGKGSGNEAMDTDDATSQVESKDTDPLVKTKHSPEPLVSDISDASVKSKPASSSSGSSGSDKTKKKKKKKKKDRRRSSTSAATVSSSESDNEAATEEGWSIVETVSARRKRAQAARRAERLSRDGRVNMTLIDLLGTDNRYHCPPRESKDGSDDEDWLDDQSHPIDWYVDEVNDIIDVPRPSIRKDLRRKLKYAWRSYVPKDPCAFLRCAAPYKQTKKPKTWSTLARFARHLVEKHLPKQFFFHCVPGGSANACNAWSDGGMFRAQRRGDVVRHLMENGQHNRGLQSARTMVMKVWDVKGKVEKLELRHKTNTLTHRFRLTNSDWDRMNQTKSEKAEQEKGDSGGNDSEPYELKPEKRSRPVKRKDATPRDRSTSSQPAKKPKGGVKTVTETKVKSGKGGRKAPSTSTTDVGVPAVLSKTKQKLLTDVNRIVTNTLGEGAAKAVQDNFLKQQKVLEQIKAKPKAATKTTPTKASTSTVSTVVTGVPKGTEKGKKPTPVAPKPVPKQIVPLPDGMSVMEDEVVHVGAIGGEALPAPPLLGPIPPPPKEFQQIWDPRVHALRQQVVTEASQCYQRQVDQFDSALIAGGELLLQAALQTGAAAIAQREAELEANDARRQADAEFFRNKYRTLCDRVERWEAQFFREFRFSMSDWETGGFRPLYPTSVASSPANTMRFGTIASANTWRSSSQSPATGRLAEQLSNIQVTQPLIRRGSPTQGMDSPVVASPDTDPVNPVADESALSKPNDDL